MLIHAVKELSLARDISAITQIVRTAARQLVNADGATFVLRDGDQCYYADEDAIAPLWKGRRFPMSACVSGWVMEHATDVAIDDIYADERVPQDAYRPTFVRSLAMVPIREKVPAGAIGVYWATPRHTTAEELTVLRALADSTSTAIEIADSLARVLRLSHACEMMAQQNREREEQSAYTVHDLKSPAMAISMAAALRLRAHDSSEADRKYWKKAQASAELVQRAATNLLDIARAEDGKLTPKVVPTSPAALLEDVQSMFAAHAEMVGQTLEIAPDGAVEDATFDPELVRRVLQNLTDNALRHNAKNGRVTLEAKADAEYVTFTISDEGPGVPDEMKNAIFDKYVQIGGLNANRSGQGLGLTFCRSAVEAHGGRIWVEDNQPTGTRFCFTIPTKVSSGRTA
ncbi:MAG: GAF domain-containing sensor histidine kinase [Minicystis sp.]